MIRNLQLNGKSWNRTARASNRSGTTQARVLGISKNLTWVDMGLTRCGHAGVFPQSQVLWNFRSSIWLYFVLNVNSFFVYTVNVEVLNAPFLALQFFFCYSSVTFLMILSVRLLSLLLTLLCTESVSRNTIPMFGLVLVVATWIY